MFLMVTFHSVLLTPFRLGFRSKLKTLNPKITKIRCSEVGSLSAIQQSELICIIITFILISQNSRSGEIFRTLLLISQRINKIIELLEIFHIYQCNGTQTLKSLPVGERLIFDCRFDVRALCLTMKKLVLKKCAAFILEEFGRDTCNYSGASSSGVSGASMNKTGIQMNQREEIFILVQFENLFQ